jgi:hypothetical protein
MSADPAWLDFANYKYGRPMLATDPYDDAEWQAFQTGWDMRDTAVHNLAEVGRRVLYGLSVGDTKPTWFQDRDALSVLVTQGISADPPPAPADYTDAQVTAFNAGWTIRHAEVAPIYSVGTDVLAGLSDGRATAADATWMSERDALREMLGV